MPSRLAAVAILVLVGAGCRTSTDGGPAPAVAGGDAYIGQAECARCHQNVAATYRHTGMGRAAFAMAAVPPIEDFTRENTFVDETSGVRYRMTLRDGRAMMRQFVLDPAGREIAADEREMVYVIGSGNHSRSYVTEVDGRLYEMPVCWYPQASTWDYCPGFERHNGHFGRKITASCVFCHNGRMVLAEGEDNRYEGEFPSGIDCERCHGPGRRHVERWAGEPARGNGEADPTIVNPARLPADRRMHVCFQCHLGDSRATERVSHLSRKVESYRPGEKVTEVFVPFEYRDLVSDEIGVSAQAERFLRSRCFRESGGKLDCLSCHNPHSSVYRVDRPADAFTKVCLGCHAKEACKAPVAGDDCVSCHMQRLGPDDHPHALFTDHWIRRDPKAGAGEPRKTLNVGPVLPAELKVLPPAVQAYYAGRAMFGLATDYGPGPQRTGLLEASEAALRGAMAKGFDRAEGWFVLGKALVELGRPKDAVETYREVLRRDPVFPEADYRLARALAELGEIDAARRAYESALRTKANDARALAEIGHLELNAGKLAEALDLYDRSLAADPAVARVHGNRAIALQRLGRKDEAIAAIRRAAALDPEDAEVWRVYGGMTREAGFTAEADAARERTRFLLGRGTRPSEEPGMTMGGM